MPASDSADTINYHPGDAADENRSDRDFGPLSIAPLGPSRHACDAAGKILDYPGRRSRPIATLDVTGRSAQQFTRRHAYLPDAAIDRSHSASFPSA